MKTETLEDRLVEAGCDDALVGLGQHGRLALSFARVAGSAEAAITSAIEDVQAALPRARLVEAGPDLVGVTEMADVLDWFASQQQRPTDPVLQEVARVGMTVNVRQQAERLTPL